MLLWIMLGSLLLEKATVLGQIDLSHCRYSLGMQDKRIKDDKVTASSFHAPGTGPKYARNGGGRGLEFTPRYKLNYSRDGLNWLQWRNYHGEAILDGNNDSRTVRTQRLNPGIPAVYFIRFIPVTKSPRSVCARIEIYGCSMKTSVVQYNIPTPDGTFIGENWSFDDETYDGKKESKSYHGGLGQLTDGVLGNDDIRQKRSHVASRVNGFDYVGWRNNAKGNRRIEMTFFFDDVRNFTAMKIHCVSSEAIQANYFKNVEVSFSLNGRTFADTPSTPIKRFHSSLSSSGSRKIVVPLQNVVARYVRATFAIRAEWMLISEVEFIDVSVDIEIDPKLLFPTSAHVPEMVLTMVESDSMKTTTLKVLHTNMIEKASKERDKAFKQLEYADVVTDRAVTPRELSNVAVISCSLVGVIVLLVSVVVILAWRQQRIKKTMITPRRAIATPHEYSDPKDALTNMHTLQPGQRFNPPDVTLCDSAVRNDVIPIPHYAETSVCSLPPPYATPPPASSRWNSSTRNENGLPKYSPPSLSESSTLLAEESCSAGPSYSDSTGFCNELLEECEQCGVIEFPRQRLQFVDKLGEGQFGEVQLCKADPILRVYANHNGTSLTGEPGDPVLVAVKFLRGDATPNSRKDFLKEAKIMSRMRDPNIVQLLAVCIEEEPYALITEYMANGDLNGYLRRFEFGDVFRDVDNLLTHGDSQEHATMSCTILLGIATQISAGMRYLASLNFVHRDLATRNCLVGAGLGIRISDFGLSRNMYQSDYYKMEGKAILPIRWMPWESVLLGKFSTASDVWAFGVTVWEIFTLCKSQPFESLSDPEVINNMNDFYEDTGNQIHPPKPEHCPDKVFEVLMRCWRRDADARPKFDHLYSFFKKQV